MFSELFHESGPQYTGALSLSARASLGMLFAVLLFSGTYLLFALYPISFAVLARVHPNK